MKGNKITRVLAMCLAAALSLSLMAGIGSTASAASVSAYEASPKAYTDIVIGKGVRLNTETYSYKQNADGTYAKDEKGNPVLETKVQGFLPENVDHEKVPIFIYNGATYLPVRAISELFGANIEWNTTYDCVLIKSRGNNLVNPNPSAVDNTAPSTVYSNEKQIRYNINVYVDDAKMSTLDSQNNSITVYLINGTTYLPLRKMADIFHASVRFNSASAADSNGKDPLYTVTIQGSVPAAPAGEIEDPDPTPTTPANDKSILDIIKDMLSNLVIGQLDNLNNVMKFLNTAKDKGVEAAIWELIDNALKDNDAISKWLDANPEFEKNLKDALGVTTRTELIQKLKDYVADNKTIINSFVDGYNAIVVGQISKIISASSKLLPEATKTTLKAYLTTLQTNLKNENLKKSIQTIIDALGTTGTPSGSTGVITDIKDKIDDVISGILGKGDNDNTGIIDNVKDQITNVITGIINKGDKGDSDNTGILGGIKDKIEDAISGKVADTVKGQITDAISGILGKFNPFNKIAA